ncbi:MAG: CapA family protein [Clostridiales bacterium]|nr:CapA family protein [Clostridiales bacterium]
MFHEKAFCSQSIYPVPDDGSGAGSRPGNGICGRGNACSHSGNLGHARKHPRIFLREQCSHRQQRHARIYNYIQQVPAENPIVFLVDAGDVIQGTIMTDDIANKYPDSEHPVIAAMNFMGYDCMTLGNHEFNWGIGAMKAILSQADFPVLGANVLNQDGSFVTGHGWTLLERGGIRVAVIGVCTPAIPIWDGGKAGIAETTFESGSVAVRKAVEEIGDRADLILVSAHMGQYAEYDQVSGSVLPFPLPWTTTGGSSVSTCARTIRAVRRLSDISTRVCLPRPITAATTSRITMPWWLRLKRTAPPALPRRSIRNTDIPCPKTGR